MNLITYIWIQIELHECCNVLMNFKLQLHLDSYDDAIVSITCILHCLSLDYAIFIVESIIILIQIINKDICHRGLFRRTLRSVILSYIIFIYHCNGLSSVSREKLKHCDFFTPWSKNMLFINS